MARNRLVSIATAPVRGAARAVKAVDRALTPKALRSSEAPEDRDMTRRLAANRVARSRQQAPGLTPAGTARRNTRNAPVAARKTGKAQKSIY